MTGRVWVVHGPNLNLIGTHRNPNTYGSATLPELNERIRAEASDLGLEVQFFQANQEGALVDIIQASFDAADAVVLNPAAYGHTSVALRDAVEASPNPVIEVHLSQPEARETFRHTSILAGVVAGRIAGFGALSYLLALHAASALVARRGNTD